MPLSSRRQKGDEVGKTKVGKGVKVELATDRRGLPLTLVVAAGQLLCHLTPCVGDNDQGV